MLTRCKNETSRVLFLPQARLCVKQAALENDVVFDRLLVSCRVTVRLSLRLSVSLCILTISVGVGIESCTILFLGRHFLFTSLDILL